MVENFPKIFPLFNQNGVTVTNLFRVIFEDFNGLQETLCTIVMSSQAAYRWHGVHTCIFAFLDTYWRKYISTTSRKFRVDKQTTICRAVSSTSRYECEILALPRPGVIFSARVSPFELPSVRLSYGGA